MSLLRRHRWSLLLLVALLVLVALGRDPGVGEPDMRLDRGLQVRCAGPVDEIRTTPQGPLVVCRNGRVFRTT